MQPRKLNLREIIWEITGRCENGCKYCGSKDVWNTKIDVDTIYKIATQICDYPPEEIDISGGDPLLIDLEVHKNIVGMFREKNIKCKLLTNPKSASKCPNFLDLYDLYEIVGVSVNTEKELEQAEKMVESFDSKKITIITNFNLGNLFHYDDIEKFVARNELSWMVQYTIYKDKDSDLAIYNNSKATKKLFERINMSMNAGVKIILSDNINNGPCLAGHNTIGILYNGSVVPCLSMRSWHDNIADLDQGNILMSPLKEIWEEGFYNYRFCEYECCKDICMNRMFERYQPCTDPNAILKELNGKSDQDKLLEELFKKNMGSPQPYTPNQPNTVMLYGAQQYPTTFVAYAVYQAPSGSSASVAGVLSTSVSTGQAVYIDKDKLKDEFHAYRSLSGDKDTSYEQFKEEFEDEWIERKDDDNAKSK